MAQRSFLNASIVGSKGSSANSIYSATKAAVRSVARTWTADLKDRRICVNAISPGSIDTPCLSGLLASSEVGEQRMKMIAASVPLGRFGTPEEIAKAVVFLASDNRQLGHGHRIVCGWRTRAGVARGPQPAGGASSPHLQAPRSVSHDHT